MAYTTPKTWTNEPLIASDLNTYIRDNQQALKDPPSDNYANESTTYTTTSTTATDIDGTNLSLSITTTGGDVFVMFSGQTTNNGSGNTNTFYVDVDATDYLIAKHQSGQNEANSDRNSIAGTRVITGLDAGSHTFKMQWKVSAGTADLDWVEFIVREIS